MKVIINYRNGFGTRKEVVKAFDSEQHLNKYIQKLSNNFCSGIDYREIN